MIHLMHGFIGSGKTTLARKIADESGALRFTPDEWMSRLYGEDPPAGLFRSHLTALLGLFRELWIPAARSGCDIILDYGFWTESSRREIMEDISALGLRHTWVILPTPIEECRRRNAERAAAGGSPLCITDDTFDLLLREWEPMTHTGG